LGGLGAPGAGRIAVRRGTRADLDALVALWLALTRYHVHFESLFMLRPGAEAEVRRLIEAQLRDPETLVLLHAPASGPDGLCLVRVDRAPPIHPEVVRAEITDLYVADASRRRGVGRALAEAALGWVGARGIARVEVRVAARNRDGHAFWQALGFEPFVDVLHRRL
jgi:GNAT superfamily N-acetyltransferase